MRTLHFAPWKHRLGEKLADAGIACYMLDYLGHGHSDADPKASHRENIADWKIFLEDAEYWHAHFMEANDEQARMECWSGPPPSFFFISQGIGSGLAACMVTMMQEKGHPYEERVLGHYMISPHFQLSEHDMEEWTPATAPLMLCCGMGSSRTAVQPHPSDLMPWAVYGHRDAMKLETELDTLECELANGSIFPLKKLKVSLQTCTGKRPLTLLSRFQVLEMLQHFHDFAIDGTVPCRIAYGSKDILVSSESIERFMRVNNYSRLCKNKKKTEEAEAVLWTLDGIGHHILHSKHSIEVMQKILDFFVKLDQDYTRKWRDSR